MTGISGYCGAAINTKSRIIVAGIVFNCAAPSCIYAIVGVVKAGVVDYRTFAPGPDAVEGVGRASVADNRAAVDGTDSSPSVVTTGVAG